MNVLPKKEEDMLLMARNAVLKKGIGGKFSLDNLHKYICDAFQYDKDFTSKMIAVLR